MIRIRRVPQRLPIGRKYEIVYAPSRDGNQGWRKTTRSAVKALEPLLGVGDAWSFVHAADAAWDRGDRGWAVEYAEPPSAG